MVKRPLANIAAISSTLGLVTASIFCYMPYSPEPLDLGKTITDYDFLENQPQGDKTAREISPSSLWEGVHFPVDDYDSQELGRKIANWVIKKVKNR